MYASFFFVGQFFWKACARLCSCRNSNTNPEVRFLQYKDIRVCPSCTLSVLRGAASEVRDAEHSSQFAGAVSPAFLCDRHSQRDFAACFVCLVVDPTKALTR